MSKNLRSTIPSIWRGDFRSFAEYQAASGDLAKAFSVFDAIDDRMLHSRHPFSFRAYCPVCDDVTSMRFDWTYGGSAGGSSVHPAWTETSVCEQCNLNSRMRALIDYLNVRVDLGDSPRVYAAEQTTPSYRRLKSMFPGIVGSEFLGPDYRRGNLLKRGILGRVRHEDLTALTFADNSFDLVITQDVFEHIPDFRAAFGQIFRVLSPGGSLVFTIPFFYDAPATCIRATIAENGEVVHHLPPEIHGNPVSSEGALCFQNFGWDVLDELRAVGFADARASLYWGPWQGHLGFSFFVLSAQKK